MGFISLGVLNGGLMLIVSGISVDGLVIVGFVYDGVVGNVICVFCWM